MAKLSFNLTGTIPVFDDSRSEATWSVRSEEKNYLWEPPAWEKDWRVLQWSASEITDHTPAWILKDDERAHPELYVDVPEPRDRMKEGHYPRLLAYAATGGFDSSTVSRIHRKPLSEPGANSALIGRLVKGETDVPQMVWAPAFTPAEQPEMYKVLLDTAHSDRTFKEYRGRAFARGRFRFWPAGRYYDGAEEYRADRPTHAAVVIDLEMAGVEGSSREPDADYFGRADEIISVSVIDFFTGERLMDNLVRPRRRVVDWRTHVTGIGAADMDRAEAAGTLYPDSYTMRRALLELIDSDTVVVGHGFGNDINMLRMNFPLIVECQILADRALEASAYRYYITNEESVGRVDLIRQPLRLDMLASMAHVLNFRRGSYHDAWEDVMTTREVALCLLRNGEDVYVYMVGEAERLLQEEWWKLRVVITGDECTRLWRWIKDTYRLWRGQDFARSPADPYDVFNTEERRMRNS